MAAIAARGLCLLSLDSISREMLDLVAATWWNRSVETFDLLSPESNCTWPSIVETG